MSPGATDQARTKAKGSRAFRDAFSKTNIKAFCTNATQKVAVVAHKVASEVGLKSKKD